MITYCIEFDNGDTDESERGFLEIIEVYIRKYHSEYDPDASAPNIKRMFVTGKNDIEVANCEWAVEAYQYALDDAAQASRHSEEPYIINRE